ncbi:MAG: acylphosphatase [Patescibacteria group bacterium]|nr:acylphosphatase [Patescibacteria group bacterium]
MEGIIIFNKPKGFTSAQITNYFKNKFRKRVGHGGALDPLAEGVLILGVDSATKDLKFFLSNSKKTYFVKAIVGISSSTYDIEPLLRSNGRKDFSADCQKLPSEDEIKSILKSFKGEIYQTPPPFSALKYRGQPLYKLVERKKLNLDIINKKIRRLNVYEICFLGYSSLERNNIKIGILDFEIVVDSGFYVRSLINDMGKKLNCGFCLLHLLRKKIEIALENYYPQQSFAIDESLSFKDFENGLVCMRAKVFGKVQGVNFRFFTKKVADSLGISGYVKNLDDGTVEVVGRGKIEKIEKLINFIKIGPPLAKINQIKIVILNYFNFVFDDFRVIY